MARPNANNPWGYADLWMIFLAPFCVGGLLTGGLSSIWKPLEYSFIPLYVLGVGIAIWIRASVGKR